MKLRFNYGNSVAVLPSLAIEKLDKATKKDIKLLFVLASDNSLLDGTKRSREKLLSLTGLSESDVESSLAFWRGAGVLDALDAVADKKDESSQKEEKPEKKEPEKKNKKLERADELPKYTTAELTDLLERREGYRRLINECQQIFGKVFNTSEINVLIALTDYLGLDEEYIMLLFAYCGKREHKSVRMVEKLAHRFFDEGILDSEVLGERLKAMEMMNQIEPKIKKLFGLDSRAFTKKERTLVQSWVSEYDYDIDIIEKAYELTIDSIGKPSIPYAGSIMERWHSEGIKTKEDIEKDIDAHKKSKGADDGSFDTDEFLEAAIKRSFGEK